MGRCSSYVFLILWDLTVSWRILIWRDAWYLSFFYLACAFRSLVLSFSMRVSTFVVFLAFLLFGVKNNRTAIFFFRVVFCSVFFAFSLLFGPWGGFLRRLLFSIVSLGVDSLSRKYFFFKCIIPFLFFLRVIYLFYYFL